jgi:hypothetical protein
MSAVTHAAHNKYRTVHQQHRETERTADLVHPLAGLLQHLSVGLGVERRTAAQQDIEHHAGGEHVRGLGAVPCMIRSVGGKGRELIKNAAVLIKIVTGVS